jgi:hypothetical protein
VQFSCPKIGNTSANSVPFQVEELTPAGTDVLGLEWPISSLEKLRPNDNLAPVIFTLASASADFVLDSATGKLTTKRPLSYNDKKTIDVIIGITTTATYAGLKGAKYADACTVRIQVVDKNQAPALSDILFDLKENMPKGTEVGTVVATDTDTNSFTYRITSVVPSAWTEALKIDKANVGKIVVGDAKLIDYEALAEHDFRIVLQVTVADNHPIDPKTSNATVTVNLVDLDDLALEPDPASLTTNSLRTEGGEDACFVGSGFSDLSQVKSGVSWEVAATYSDGSNTYISPLCETRSLKKICCKTAPGIGSSHKWSFQLTLPRSVSGLPVVSRMVKKMSFAPTKTTSYKTPSIISLTGAVNMGTSGGDTVDVNGRDLGPAGTNGVATYESVSGDLSKEVSCTSVLPASGAANVVMRCTSQPGFGGPLRWRIVVGGQVSQWTSFSTGGNPMSSYAGPEVTNVEPTSGPTVGGYSIMITGINFALRSSVSIGSYPAPIIRSNYTHIEASVGGGMGQKLQVKVQVGNLTSPSNTDVGIFSYDAPAIHNVSVISRGFACKSVKHADPSTLHGCTQGGTILLLTGANFGPGCEVSDEATSSEYACACGVRLGASTVCAVPVETGSWCSPLIWGHSEIRCAVQPGAGGKLPVGVVSAGVHFSETNSPTFSYDAPVVYQITPATVSVDGGQLVSIVGDNFGPAGTPVVVEPANVLECDHSNTSHTLVQCVVNEGRGAGMPVHVSVGGQRSVATTTNISYSLPRITSIDPNRGNANDPVRVTIYGEDFGNFRVSVRIFMDAKPCTNALWMPVRPPEFTSSYLLCEPPNGDTSGTKTVSIEFFEDETFSKSLYPELSFDGLYMVICSKGEYKAAAGVCNPCPTGATCEGADTMPIAQPGYMQLSNASSALDPGNIANSVVQFTKCTPEAACRGGGMCAVGYVTPDNNCVGCEKQFYKLAGECKPCPDTAGLMLGIYIAVVILFGIFGLLLVKKGPSVAVTGVGLDYYQVLSIFVGFGIKWPAPVKDILNVVSISNMNIELVSPQCTIDFEYHQKWLAIEFAPLGLGILALVGYGVVLLKKVASNYVWHANGWKGGKKREHGDLHRHLNAIVGATILMFQFCYIYCTKTAFEVFACETKENGRSYMYFDPEVECWTGNHAWLWPLALFFAALYGVGIPIIFTVIVIRNRKKIKQDQVLRVLGTGSVRSENPHYEFRKRYYKLYYRFKPRYHYWGEVILFRKFLIVLITIFLKHNPTLQATCAVMILFVSYSVHIRTLPYLRNDLLGRNDLQGVDDNAESGTDSLVPLNEDDAKQRRIESALAMVNQDPKPIPLRHSAMKLAKTGGLLAKSMRPVSGSFLNLMKKPGSAVVTGSRGSQLVEDKTQSTRLRAEDALIPTAGNRGSAELSGVELTDVNTGVGNVSVSIADGGETKGTSGVEAAAATTPHFSSDVHQPPPPLVIPQNRVRRASQYQTERHRRLSALVRMGEGNSAPCRALVHAGSSILEGEEEADAGPNTFSNTMKVSKVGRYV